MTRLMLHWTTDNPTVAGLYWYRPSVGLKGIIVEVEFLGGTLTVIGTNAACSGAVAQIQGQWAGPLEPPR